MIVTPSSFSYEFLSNLKFKDLQKLSAQFHVNKRWAKKQELIENLLALKEKDETATNNEQEDKTEWRDGSTVFSDSNHNNESEMRRLTFNMGNNCWTKNVDSHLPSVVAENDNNLCRPTILSRETYEIPPKRFDLDAGPLSEARATFNMPFLKFKGNFDSRATFEVCQNKTKLLEENEMRSKNVNCKDKFDLKLKKNITLKKNFRSVKFSLDIKNKKTEKCETAVKTLTIPSARITKGNKENETRNNNLIMLSNKSINIKKCTRTPKRKCDFIKSPEFSMEMSVKQKTLMKALTETESTNIIQTDGPIGIQCSEEKLYNFKTINNKENSNTVLKTKISTTAIDQFNSNTNFEKVDFRTSEPRKIPLRKTLLKDVGVGKFNLTAAQTPGNKTAVKMPDFNKIHKRHFEQMDSLPDYLIKKELRIKKLFGTPQPGQQLQSSSKSRRVFRFQSSVVGKDSKESTDSKDVATLQQKKECDSKIAQKEAFKCKLPPMTQRANIKEKNRIHIQGVRTNKRFELQMKCRKL